MNIQNWKIFNKAGSFINWTPDPYINLQFTSNTGIGAEGYLVTDINEHAITGKITNGGYGYDDAFTTSYTYAFGNGATLTSADASVHTIDVSIFNPDGKNTKSIKDVSLNLGTSFIYPSVTFAAAVFLKPVSQGLVETEHLFILEDSSSGFIRPIDKQNSTLIFSMIGDESEIQFFTVDENNLELNWTNELIFDVSVLAINTPLAINIGFRADVEGVFERIIRIYHQVGETLYTLADIVVNAESIGEDERFRTLLGNFGLPDPKDMKDVFKETDINEDLPDWEILNQKSKHMILEHDKIMPYVGTYKALINSLKWLGYDDIYIREWFKNVKENKKISFIVPFDAKDRTQTILMFNADQRKVFKKLNELSLNYCLTQETGEIDDWGTPITEDCYSYNIKEVFIKLLGLKHWLEKNIIGINCHITDITGEGIYFERVQNLAYTTANLHYDYKVQHSLTPYTIEHDSELIHSDSSINLSLLELSKTKISDLPYAFNNLIDYVWDPINPNIYTYSTDASFLTDSSRYVPVGATFQYPFVNLSDVMWKLSVEKDDAGVVGVGLVSKPLFILENEIRFYNIFDSSSQFYDISTNLKITLEEAYLRDATNDIWEDSIAYYIYPNRKISIDASSIRTITYDASYATLSGSGRIYTNTSVTKYDSTVNPIHFVTNGSIYIIADTSTILETSFQDGYMLQNYSTKEEIRFYDYVSLYPDTSNSLMIYEFDENYKVPLLSLKNYVCTDPDGSLNKFSQKYYLDIVNGKISMDAGDVPGNNPSDNLTMYINFNYDTSIDEQQITVNAVYESPRTKLFQIDPSIYYWADQTGLTGNNANFMIIDNSIYNMRVNHIGNYDIEFYAWDQYNTVFFQPVKDTYPVWIKYPTIYALVDNSTYMGYDVSKYMSQSDVNALIENNRHPIFDRNIQLQGLSLKIDDNGKPYIKVPSITYFQDLPQINSLNRIFNLTERVILIKDTSIIVDDDYQKFFTGDDVKLVKFDKGKYSLVDEVSSHIRYSSTPVINPTTIKLDQIPASFVLNASNDIYILNDTYRTANSAVNDGITETCTLRLVETSAYRVDQLVSLIVTDLSTNYSWGASYKVSAVNSSTYTFNDIIPQQFLANPGKYRIQTKQAFSSYTNLLAITDDAYEVSNNFHIYLKDAYLQEYFIDDTFSYMNILFDHDKVISSWYDPSLNLVNSNFYYYNKFITTDVSKLTILRSEYDNSTYLLNQKNIWTIIDFDTSIILMKVYNESVPFIFSSSDRYIIEAQSYDSYGNISKIT